MGTLTCFHQAYHFKSFSIVTHPKCNLSPPYHIQNIWLHFQHEWLAQHGSISMFYILKHEASPHLKQNIEAILVIMGLSVVLLDFVSVSNHTQINQWCYQIQRMGGPFAQKYFLMKGIFNSKRRYNLKMQ